MEGTAVAEVDVDQIHANSKIGKVPLSKLQIDSSYQREPSMNMVDDIAENWDEVASELLLVSDRGDRPEGSDVKGGLFIVNGQHRSLGARKRGLTEVHARIIDLRDHPDPGAVESLFRLRTNVRLGDKPLERFKAQLRSGNEESVKIVAHLDRFNTFINEKPNEEGISAVVVVEKLFRIDGTGELLDATLALIERVYGNVGGKNATGPILTSFAWFITKHANETEEGRVVDKLHSAGLQALDRRARTIGSDLGGSLWMNYYRAMVSFYNERLQDKSKLDWKMRGASSFKTSTRWGKDERHT